MNARTTVHRTDPTGNLPPRSTGLSRRERGAALFSRGVAELRRRRSADRSAAGQVAGNLAWTWLCGEAQAWNDHRRGCQPAWAGVRSDAPSERRAAPRPRQHPIPVKVRKIRVEIHHPGWLGSQSCEYPGSANCDCRRACCARYIRSPITSPRMTPTPYPPTLQGAERGTIMTAVRARGPKKTGTASAAQRGVYSSARGPVPSQNTTPKPAVITRTAVARLRMPERSASPDERTTRRTERDRTVTFRIYPRRTSRTIRIPLHQQRHERTGRCHPKDASLYDTIGPCSLDSLRSQGRRIRL
jgi:hypothetical protein